MKSTQHSENVLISVIIPVYNVENYISRCLDSVISQTYANIEIILIDDCSTDSSLSTCIDFSLRDSRISLIHLEKNTGVSHARNIGLYLAKGDLITFIDSDDYVESTFIECLYSNMIESSSEISICGLACIGANGYVRRMAKDGPACVMNCKEAVSCPFRGYLFDLCIGGKIYKRDVIGKIIFDETIKNGEDSIFLYQVLKNAEKICYIPDKLYYYVIRDGSATMLNGRYDAVDFYDRIFDDLRANFPETFPIFEQFALLINVRRAVEAVEDDNIKGQKLWSYLKKFKGNLHRHFSLRTLSFHDSKMITAEAVLLYCSAFAFWGITAVYKFVKKLLKQ